MRSRKYENKRHYLLVDSPGDPSRTQKVQSQPEEQNIFLFPLKLFINIHKTDIGG